MKRLKTWHKILIVAALILISIISCIGVFYFSKLSLIQFDENSEISINTELSPDAEDTGKIDIPSNMEVEDNVSSLEVPEGDPFVNEDILNVLLIGTDERSKNFNVNARADSIMILSLNLDKHTAKLVSLERGMGVPIEGRNIDWLTHTFRYGGANLLLKTVRDCFKVDVNKYVRVNFNTFEQLINAVGGVDISLTDKEITGLNKVGIKDIHTGVNHLNGHKALHYCRLRKIDSDWYRIKRQRNTIQAIINQTKDLGLSELNDALDTVLPLVKTNFNKSEITSLLLKSPDFMGVQLDQMTIPVKDTYCGAVGVDGRSFFKVDFAKNAQILKDFFNE